MRGPGNRFDSGPDGPGLTATRFLTLPGAPSCCEAGQFL
jgi:hypothetical protein